MIPSRSRCNGQRPAFCWHEAPETLSHGNGAALLKTSILPIDRRQVVPSSPSTQARDDDGSDQWSNSPARRPRSDDTAQLQLRLIMPEPMEMNWTGLRASTSLVLWVAPLSSLEAKALSKGVCGSRPPMSSSCTTYPSPSTLHRFEKLTTRSPPLIPHLVSLVLGSQQKSSGCQVASSVTA